MGEKVESMKVHVSQLELFIISLLILLLLFAMTNNTNLKHRI